MSEGTEEYGPSPVSVIDTELASVRAVMEAQLEAMPQGEEVDSVAMREHLRRVYDESLLAGQYVEVEIDDDGSAFFHDTTDGYERPAKGKQAGLIKGFRALDITTTTPEGVEISPDLVLVLQQIESPGFGLTALKTDLVVPNRSIIDINWATPDYPLLPEVLSFDVYKFSHYDKEGDPTNEGLLSELRRYIQRRREIAPFMGKVGNFLVSNDSTFTRTSESGETEEVLRKTHAFKRARVDDFALIEALEEDDGIGLGLVVTTFPDNKTAVWPTKDIALGYPSSKEKNTRPNIIELEVLPYGKPINDVLVKLDSDQISPNEAFRRINEVGLSLNLNSGLRGRNISLRLKPNSVVSGTPLDETNSGPFDDELAMTFRPGRWLELRGQVAGYEIEIYGDEGDPPGEEDVQTYLILALDSSAPHHDIFGSEGVSRLAISLADINSSVLTGSNLN